LADGLPFQRLVEVANIARDDLDRSLKSAFVVARSAPRRVIGATHSGVA